MIFRKKIANPLLLAAFACSACISAEEATSEEELPQWYEVEIVLFKSTSMQGLDKESWKIDSQLEKPSGIIDFLQPYFLIKGDETLESDNSESVEADESDQSAFSQSPEATTNANHIDGAETSGLVNPNQINAQEDLDSELLGSELPAEQQIPQEKPFALLSGDLFKLSNEVASLERHPEYKVISHYAWRQPIEGGKSAKHIRIAGGQDFSLEYAFNGEKRLPYFEQQATEAVSNETSNEFQNEEIDPIAIPENEAEKLAGEISDNNQFSADLDGASTDSNNEEVGKLPESDQLVAQLWVPEIDGDIKIYRGRYLHVRTNLFLRRPDKEEVEAIDLNLYDTEKLSSLTSINSNDQLTESTALFDDNSPNPIGANPFNTESETVEATHSFDFQKKDEHQFSWEIDDDFLNTESEKMYIEKLFNYPMRQSRRMRSKELHYFDHPLFGMLIMITPYEVIQTETGTDEVSAL